jgi:hypothetical protein
MGKQGSLKLLLAVLLVFGTIGTAGYAAETAVGDKAKFTDTSAHWANKYISKMAMLDIVRGYTDGSFRPDNPVSRQEAVLMALRLLGLEDDAEHATINAIYGFETDAYFKPYVDYAFSIGLVSNLEELSSYGRAKWGASPASREWIAKLTIRVIDEEEAETSSIQFSDRNDISAWAVGYVNAAAELGIVTGSNGAFNPQKPVTRAELAAFFSRAEPMLAERSPRVAEGIVTKADAAGLTIADADGKTMSFIYAAAPALYSYNQYEPISKADIASYSRVLVIHDEGIACYVEVLEEQSVQRINGTYLRSNLQNWTLALESDGVEHSFKLDPGFSIISSDGSGLDYASLVPGSEIEAAYTTIGSEHTIRQIKVLKVPLNKVSTGTVQGLSVNTGVLTVNDDESGELEEYVLDDALLSDDWTAVYGNRTVPLYQIAVGDEIRYEVENSIVTDIELLRPVHPILQMLEAVVDYNNTDSRTLYVEAGDGIRIGYVYADDVEVRLAGKENATIADIAKDDNITLYLDENNKIVKVEIANRSITTMFMVPYLNYYDQQKTLIVLDPAQKITPYYVTSNTVVTLNGNVVDHDQIAKILKENDRIDMTFSTGTNELLAIRKSDTYRGTIADIDSSKMLLTVKTESGVQAVFPLNAQTHYEIIGNRSSKLQDFRVGDAVSVTLNDAQTALASVKKIVTLEYTISDVQVSTRKVTVINDAQQKEDLTVPSTAVIRHTGKSNPTINDLKAGDHAVMTFVGRTVSEVDIPAISFGRVTAVNAEDGTFTLEDYKDGRKSKTYKLNNRELNVNDRVYVVLHVDGTQSVQELVSFEKSYWKSEPDVRAIYFLKKNFNDKNKFYLHEKAIIRKNNTIVSESSLTYGAVVTGYLLNDTIIEIIIH